MSATKHIAIFGDTHGHLRLMFQLCRLWQMNHETHLDGVLQCGDLGFFPDIGRIDKATKKFAKRDPEELGFAEYFALPKPARSDELLKKILHGETSSLETLRCDVVFCHGNHEDFEMLQQVTCEAAFAPVDVFGRINLLRAGEVVDFAGLTIGGLGGAPEGDSKRDELFGPMVSRQAANRLRKRNFDLLLSHCGPHGIVGNDIWGGSKLIKDLIQSTQPAIHVFAHHGSPVERQHLGTTDCIWLNDTNFERSREGNFHGPVEHGCMAVLAWNSADDWNLEVINEDWFKRITGTSWLHY